MKRKPKNLAFEELKDMIPAALIINGLAMVGIALYGIFEGITWRAVTGLLYGDLLAAGNFILLGASASSTLTKATAKKGQFFANMSYGGRYIGLFLLLAAGIMLNIIDIVPAFVPLFIPKLHYTFKYTLQGKSFDDWNQIN
ncbi:MAG: hypothetical protein HDT47_05680 [Ruminococcaceae bacterium]|nr:hypothetical protein [Oscillospiraceae bacterium]